MKKDRQTYFLGEKIIKWVAKKGRKTSASQWLRKHLEEMIKSETSGGD